MLWFVRVPRGSFGMATDSSKVLPKAPRTPRPKKRKTHTCCRTRLSTAARDGFNRLWFNDLIKRSYFDSWRTLGILNHPKRRGASPPTFSFSDCFKAPDPRDDRFLIRALSRHRLNPDRAAAEMSGREAVQGHSSGVCRASSAIEAASPE